ncbi:MAG TPA: glycosyltransferase family 9 protein [Lentimicrobium sp.]|nr:glycosyltransferase family 9 protein [Lentimicrobium sp.]
MAFKLLIIRFSSIGDIVLTTPVVRCIHDQRPDIEIHYLTKKRFSAILENNPYINKVYSFDSQLTEVIPDLKKERYDFVLDLHHNIRSRYTLLSIKRSYRSFNKLNIEKWLMVSFKINRLPAVHIVDRYLETARSLGIKNDGKGLDFFIPLNQEIKISEQFPELAKGFIAFVTGGNHNTKIFPADMVAGVCRSLNLPVVLLGGKEDAERGNITEYLSEGKVVNLCGKLSLMESASIVRQAAAVISNDTGLMHIAAAFRKPLVSIWGNTIPEFGMYPYMSPEVPSLISEVKGLSCRPCSKIGYKECPLKHFNCMRNQDIAEIIFFVNQIVKANTSNK